jgi:hypothetical protein
MTRLKLFPSLSERVSARGFGRQAANRLDLMVIGILVLVYIT